MNEFVRLPASEFANGVRVGGDDDDGKRKQRRKKENRVDDDDDVDVDDVPTPPFPHPLSTPDLFTSSNDFDVVRRSIFL